MVINGSYLLFSEPIKNMVADKKSAFGTSYGLGEAGYDIRIKQNIEFKSVPSTELPYVSERQIYVDGEFQEQGRFILASAIEEFTMPSNLTGIVHDKSTWARRGLSVFNTVIEPGWNGFLTLELVYHGNGDLVIPAGSGIAQVMFHKVIQPTEYTGKYQNQENFPVPAIDSK